MKSILTNSATIIMIFSLIACGGGRKVALVETKNQTHRRDGALSNSERDLERNTPKMDPKTSEREELPKNFANNTARYIYEFKATAKQEMRKYGIPASITLAQGILESGNGLGELTSRSNNHFGIKCNGWEGEKVYHDDDRRQECFRKYTNPKYSFRDHSLFLKNRSRYAALFRLQPNDYKGWARGLKKAGYATDPAYPRKLIRLIERYDLDKFDKQVLKDGGVDLTNDKPERPNDRDTYTVKKGDTLYSIAKKTGTSVKKLKQLNNLRSNNISIGQQLEVKPDY